MKERQQLSSRVDALIDALTVADVYDVRARIRRRLERLGPSAARCLLKHLQHPDCLTRWETVNLLGEFAEPATLRPLVAFALGEDEVHARWRAFWAVSCFGRRRAVPLLRPALAGAHPTRRWRAALMLSMFDCREVGAVLVRGLRSPDPWIQWEAINAIRSLGLAGAESALARFLRADSERDHRQEAVLALGAIGSEKALLLVERALDDPEADVRWRASMALADSGDRKWSGALRRRLERERDHEVLAQLRSDLQTLRVSAAAPPLPVSAIT